MEVCIYLLITLFINLNFKRMRKNFLLLFLLTLLPIAGWSQVDLSDGWTIALDVSSKTYTGKNVTPTITLVHATDPNSPLAASNFNVSWSPSTPKDVLTDGYTVTVTSNMTNTYGSLKTPTAKFYVLKANSAEKTAGALHADKDWDGDEIDLVTTAPTATFGTVEYQVNGGAWSTSIPKATNVGAYEVKYRVAGTDNYNGFQVTLGTVTISGLNISPLTVTAPTAKDGLAFQWNNGAAVAQELINAGSVENHGTVVYRVGTSGSYSTTIPTKANAGNYTVYWKVAGATGYNDYEAAAPSNQVAVSIAKVTPEVTAATGATSLTYTGVAQALLSATGSATFGATSTLKYDVRYKATADAAWGAYTTDLAFDDVKGTNAGIYGIVTKVPVGTNYNAAQAGEIEVTINKAVAFTSAPTAANLTWNNAAQQLINAGAGTVVGVVQYSLGGGAWTDDITNIKATAAGNYNVQYKVDAAHTNYVTVPATTISNVKINKKPISVKVNNVTKTYDKNVSLFGADDAAVDGGLDKLTFISRVEGDGLDYTAIAYKAITDNDANRNAGTHEDLLTVNLADLQAVSDNYEYTIIPGNLTINQRELTITANAGLEAMFGTEYDISNDYTPTGLQPGDVLSGGWPASTNAFSTLPVLTTNAAAVNPEVGVYNLAFTKGTLRAGGNYKMSTAGENSDGYVIGANKFTVTPDPAKKIVITVLPHTQSYTGVAESWANLVEGTDYVVTGLISGDALTVAPTFTRSDATNFNVGTYDLTASGAAVADMSKYPGGFVYNNSTFEITKKELVATVTKQIIAKDHAEEFDNTAWDVTGLVNSEAKTVLGATLALTNPADVATAGVYANGITLTIDPACNYSLKAGTETGILQVVAPLDLALDPADAYNGDRIEEAADYIAANPGTVYTVDFSSMAMNAKEWYAFVLPFATTPAELVGELGTYVVVNRLKSSSIDANGKVDVKFGIEMDEIPAGEPFLVKPATLSNWDATTFTLKVIKKDIKNVVTDKATFTGTYNLGNSVKWGENLDGTANADAKYRWLAHKEYKGDNNWKNPKTNAHELSSMEAYLVLDPAATGARVFVEDFDFESGTTAIKSLSVDDIHGMAANGLYNLNGMKMQNVPTQKGVYIMNGKKYVVK